MESGLVGVQKSSFDYSFSGVSIEFGNLCGVWKYNCDRDHIVRLFCCTSFILPITIMDLNGWAAYYAQAQQWRLDGFRHITALVTMVMNLYMLLMLHMLQQIPPHPTRQPYHTSALTGADWVIKLMAENPRHIQTELGVSHLVFVELLAEMTAMGLGGSRHVTLQEQLAIFLYMSITGNTIWHTGEHFSDQTRKSQSETLAANYCD